MKVVSMRELSMIGGAALLAACQGAPSAPENPTWTDDVYPIIQGNCGSCHGPAGDQTRYDFSYDDGNLGCDELVTAYNAAASKQKDGHNSKSIPSIAMFNTIPTFLKPDAESRMPPPPADVLPAWQRDVLDKWDGKRNTRDNNADPEARSLALPKDAISGDTKFFVDVSDPDGDQVIGQVKIGMVDPINVQGVGRTTVELLSADLGKLTSGRHDVNVDLCDGQNKVTIKVGTITKK